MQTTKYIRIARKRWWLILLCVVVAAGLAYYTRHRQSPVYQAQATVAVGRSVRSANPGTADIRNDQDLARTYQQLVKNTSVMTGTINALNLPMSVKQLRTKIDASIISQTSLLVIRASANKPELAADIANEVAHQLILNSPANLTPDEQAQLEAAQKQIDDLNVLLEQFRSEFSDLNQKLVVSNDPATIDSLLARRRVITDQIDEVSGRVADFTTMIVTLQDRSNILSIIEAAEVPTDPVPTNLLRIVLLAAVAGAGLGMGAALVMEYGNDTIVTSEEVAGALDRPILAVVGRYGRRRDSYTKRLITNHQLAPTIPEAYHTLRTNLNLTGPGNQPATYLVTSPGPGEGKTLTTANLALSFAEAGMRVLLVEADFRKPTLHTVFGLDNSVGLTTLVSETVDSRDNGTGDEIDEARKVEEIMQQSADNPLLKIISSGPLPENPAAMVGSAVLRYWMQCLPRLVEADVTLFDSPPCLLVPDAQVLASVTDAKVLLVLEAGRTRLGAAKQACDRFALDGIQIHGVVLNKSNTQVDQYYGHTYYRATYP
jgi:capsular exopolysaccharide synthesis family protein